MQCKEWWNGGMCSQKFNFIHRLPFNVIRNISLAERLATVILCKGCAYRMYILPKYACVPESVRKYRMLWKNRSILSKMLGEEDMTEGVEAKMAMLMAVLRRR